MGLDSFWRDEENNEVEVKFDRELNLCGGMFSANGMGSFRGKVYADFIAEVTDVSIYQEKIDNDTVRAMADKLSQYADVSDDFIWDDSGWEVNGRAARDLAEMFRVYGNAGACLYGWW